MGNVLANGRVVFRHTMEDWLNLHEVSKSECQQILLLGDADFEYVDLKKPGKLELSTDEIWQLASKVFLASYTIGHEVILSVEENCKVHFFDGKIEKNRSFTVNEGGNGYPYIQCCHRGNIEDLITAQHEFSHAVQIVASQGRFVAPVLRETCAYLGEHSLLKYLNQTNSQWSSVTHAAWKRNSARTHEKFDRILLEALEEPQTPYDYNWNYPLARVLAKEANEHLPEDLLWGLFRGETSLRQLIDKLARN